MRGGGVGGEGRQGGNVCGEGGGLNIFFRCLNAHQVSDPTRSDFEITWGATNGGLRDGGLSK